MTRSTFGGTVSDFVATIGPGGQVRAVPATLMLWDAETGGTQVVDLLLDGDATTTIPVPAGGQIPAFQGPDGVGELWASAGGARVRIVAEGKRGLPGVNAVPTIEALSDYLDDPEPNAFKESLSATSARSQLRSPLLASKILGGNITVKPGYDWHQLWAEWDWDNWIKPQVDRAVADGFNTVRIIGAPNASHVSPSFPDRATSTAYDVERVRTNGGNLYRVTTAGTTGAGSGPSGTGAGISDGTVVWDYVGPANLTQPTQAVYNERWAQLAVYCTQRGLALYPALAEQRLWDAVAPGDYTNAALVTELCDTATVLAAFSCVIGFDIFQEGDLYAGAPWEAGRTYSLGTRVTNGARKYISTTGGTAAGSGGPTGTGAGITDGTAVWDYVGEALTVADIVSVYASVRAVASVPLTTSFPPAAVGYAFDDRDTLWALLAVADGGPDFIDLHLYTDAVEPRDIDYLAHRTSKPILIGEFGANQAQSSDDQAAQYEAVKALHQRQGVVGSIVWALADQGTSEAARLGGIWDNSGFVQGVSPLSSTSGRRTALTAIMSEFQRAPTPEPYRPQNLLTPERAFPKRSLSTLPGSQVGYWSVGANTARIADPRGIGFRCVAGGSVTSALVGTTSVDPIAVEGLRSYELAVDLLAEGVGREVSIFIGWYNASNVQVGSSGIVKGTDDPAAPALLRVVSVAPGTAVKAQPTVSWSSAQATNEVHIIRSAYFGPDRPIY